MIIAILMTCYNRREKTIACLDSIQQTVHHFSNQIILHVFLTDDGCTDGTADAIRKKEYSIPVHVLQGTGDLYWNGGMILAWKTAIKSGKYDGYLWINDDITLLPDFWEDLLFTDSYCRREYGQRGIYVGSTKDPDSGELSYGGFYFINKWTLKDRFVIPDGNHCQPCEAAHGNITFVSSEVVEKRGVFDDRYRHGGTDHDYTYLAHKAGIPILVLPRYAAVCKNDHLGHTLDYTRLPLLKRIRLFWSPKGYNMHNTLLFNRRCFPYRVPLVFFAGVAKCLLPTFSYRVVQALRK